MPRIPNSNRSPAKLVCPVDTCGKECRTHSGLTQHLNAKHKDYQLGTPSPLSTATIGDRIVPESDLSESSLSDAQMLIPPDSDLGAWDAFGSNHNSDFEIPPLPGPLLPSQPNSPSRESEANDSKIFMEYHPLISGE